MHTYRDRVLPRLIDWACGGTEELRGRACAGLHGEVVEIGFGSGHNVACYPPEVTGVDAVEPSARAWTLSEDRRAASAIPVRHSGRDAQALPYADDTFDSALSTWTLCTVPDPDAALRELRRVLRPGGVLHVVEHGLAPDADVLRWQRRIEPLHRRFLGGCRVTREPARMIAAAGFTLLDVDEFYDTGPRYVSRYTVATATA